LKITKSGDKNTTTKRVVENIYKDSSTVSVESSMVREDVPLVISK